MGVAKGKGHVSTIKSKIKGLVSTCTCVYPIYNVSYGECGCDWYI